MSPRMFGGLGLEELNHNGPLTATVDLSLTHNNDCDSSM